MAKLIKWRVSERPTGDYASFQYRSWPLAYVGDNAVVQIVSTGKGRGNTHGYDPHNAKTGNHDPLRVMVRWPVDTTLPNGAWQWKYLKGQFPTLAEAKKAAEMFWEHSPNQLPKAE